MCFLRSFVVLRSFWLIAVPLSHSTSSTLKRPVRDSVSKQKTQWSSLCSKFSSKTSSSNSTICLRHLVSFKNCNWISTLLFALDLREADFDDWGVSRVAVGAGAGELRAFWDRGMFELEGQTFNSSWPSNERICPIRKQFSLAEPNDEELLIAEWKMILSLMLKEYQE